MGGGAVPTEPPIARSFTDHRFTPHLTPLSYRPEKLGIASEGGKEMEMKIWIASFLFGNRRCLSVWESIAHHSPLVIDSLPIVVDPIVDALNARILCQS